MGSESGVYVEGVSPLLGVLFSAPAQAFLMQGWHRCLLVHCRWSWAHHSISQQPFWCYSNPGATGSSELGLGLRFSSHSTWTSIKGKNTHYIRGICSSFPAAQLIQSRYSKPPLNEQYKGKFQLGRHYGGWADAFAPPPQKRLSRIACSHGRPRGHCISVQSDGMCRITKKWITSMRSWSEAW